MPTAFCRSFAGLSLSLLSTLAWGLDYQLLRSLPREKDHFTEGLLFHQAMLIESTGHYGQSALHIYQGNDYAAEATLPIPAVYFAEGIAIVDNILYQLTWQGGTVLRYNLQWQPLPPLHIGTEGWGLTSDGQQLISSDGSDVIVFRRPTDLRETRSIHVHDRQQQARRFLNELEWIDGYLYANIWHSDRVAIIDPDDGLIVDELDFSGLTQQAKPHSKEDTLNGLAWDASRQMLLVTGKNWPFWFEVRLPNRPVKTTGSAAVRQPAPHSAPANRS